MNVLGGHTGDLLIVAAGAVGTVGVCYLGYSYFNSGKTKKPLRGSQFGREDLTVPLVLESEYRDFKDTCLEADPIASAFLKELPESWFDFNKNLLQLVQNTFAREPEASIQRALVIGSETGFLAFKLAEICTEVKAVDISFSKVVTCFKFQNRTPVVYHFPLEGSYRTVQKSIHLIDLLRPTGKRRGATIADDVEFINADPSEEFPTQLGEFQGVFLSNTLNDLDDPESLLQRVHRYVADGGYLFIISDYNWSRTTNQHEGFGTSGVKTSVDFFRRVLSEHFEFFGEKNIMQVLPESLRSCHVRNCHVTIWSRSVTQGI